MNKGFVKTGLLLEVFLFLALLGGCTSKGTSSSLGPDVVIVTFNLSDSVLSPGQSVSFNATIKNSGGVPTASVNLSIYLSKDVFPNTSDVELTSIGNLILNPGESKTLRANLTIPSSTVAGAYYLIAKANVPNDQNFANNIKYLKVSIIVVNTTSSGVAVVSTGNTDIGLIPSSTSLTPIPLNPSQATSLNCSKVNQGWICPVLNLAPTVSFSLDSCSADPIAKKVVCIGYNSQNVSIFDLSKYLTTLNPKDITVKECDLSPNSSIPSASFSGGSCINCGVATDPGDNRFIVASGDGFRVVSYNVSSTGACDVKKVYLLSTYNIAEINENFAYDPQRNWIINPEYTVPAKLWIIDVAKDKVYSWNNTLDCATLNISDITCSSFLAPSIDSVSIDTSTGITLMTIEYKLKSILVDLGQAVFNSSNNSFSAPYTVVDMVNVSTASGYSGVSIEPTSHIAFLSTFFYGNEVAVLQLPTSSGNNGIFPTPSQWLYNSFVIPYNDVCDANPGDGFAGYAWSNTADPHGLGILTSSVNGTPYGILISRAKDCIAVIDLKKFLNAPKIPGRNEVDTTNYDLISNGLLYFIKVK